MNCSFSGFPVPIDKLFVLYYPPAAAHEAWDKSFFAAARAREALGAITEDLERFFVRHVVTARLLPGVLVLLAGLAVASYWVGLVVVDWVGMGFVSRYALPLAVLAVGLWGWYRVRAFLYRWSVWRSAGRDAVGNELAAVRRLLEGIPADPDAEEAAAIMRREVPSVLSELAFFGANFQAFTYMDYVLGPKLRHPGEPKDLPQGHSLYRDAYYVGEIVYDNWRTFHKDRRTTADPRFEGSGGRRGVI